MSHDPAEDREPNRADETIGEYLLRIDRGEAVDREQFIAEHQDVADELRVYFADCDAVEREGILVGADAQVVGTGVAGSSPTMIRYFGDYELLGELGRGGMGVVYLATQMSLRRTVAVKMIRPDELDREGAVERFQREAEAVAQLRHPRIVAIHEIGRHEGQHYFSMDYIPGRSLAEMLREQPLSPEKAAGYARKIAEAVHFAHEHGTIHRDLKPSNILVDERDEPHVTDFGLAKIQQQASDLTLAEYPLGTPAYMPPEQAEGQHDRVSPRSDVYSLGATIYDMLTGRPPFKAASWLETLEQVIHSEPVAPRVLNPSVPRDLETICLKCLSKDPVRRYDSADALSQDLRRYLEGKPIIARPVGRIERFWRWCRREPVVASLTAAVAIVLVAGIAVSSFYAIVAADSAKKALAEYTRANEQILHLRTVRYIQHIGEADKAISNGNLDRAMAVLSACEADLRGWEHSYLWTKIRRRRIVLQRGVNYESVSFSPDGKRIVAGGGNFFSNIGDEVQLTTWDLVTGQPMQTIMRLPMDEDDPSSVRHMSNTVFSPDGASIALSEGTLLMLCDATTLRRIRTFNGHSGDIHRVTFSPDGKRLASCSEDKTIRLWEAESGTLLHTLEGHQRNINAVAFSPDGKQLISSSDDKTIKLWETETGTLLRTFEGHQGAVNAVAFSPDGKRLASGDDQTLRLWSTESGEPLRVLENLAHGVRCLAFSPDGTRLVDGDNERTTFRDTATGEVLFSFRTSAEGLCFSPDGRRLAVAGNGVAIWSLEMTDGETSVGVPKGGSLVAFSPDGTRAVSLKSADTDSLELLDVRTGRQICRFGGKSEKRAILEGRLSGDNRYFAASCDDGTLKVWEVETGRKVAALKTADRAQIDQPRGFGFFFGRQFYFGTEEGKLCSCDLATKRVAEVLKTGKKGIHWWAVSPDESHVVSDDSPVTTQDGTLRLWNLVSGEEVRRLSEFADKGMPNAVAFSPDGRHIVCGGCTREPRIWDLDGGHPPRSLRKHSGCVHTLAFSPDGRRLVTGGEDGAWLWDFATGERILKVRSEGVGDAIFSAADNRIYFSGHRKLVAYDGSEKPEFDTFKEYWEGCPNAGAPPGWNEGGPPDPWEYLQDEE